MKISFFEANSLAGKEPKLITGSPAFDRARNRCHRNAMKTLAALALVALAVSATAADNRPDWMKPQPTLVQRDMKPVTAAEARDHAEFLRQIVIADKAMKEEELREQIQEIVRLLQAAQLNR